jgi:PAS domain S-box-containing protein
VQISRATGEVNKILGKMLEFDWLPRIIRQGHASHERAATGQDLSGDHMSAHGKDGSLVPADAQDEYFPILYSSLPTASSHIGMDIGSDPVEREAMTQARDSGRLTATPPAGGLADIFLFAPVYGLDLPHDGVEDRRSTLEGFIRGAFVRGPLIDQIFRGVKSPQGLDIYFFRQDAGPHELPFHVRSSLLRSEPAKARPRAELEAGLHWTGEAVLADTRWTMMVVPIPGGSPLINHERSLTVLAVGLLLTMLFMTYGKLSRRHLSRLEAIAIDLRESEEKFRLLAESALNAFVMADAEGKVRFWNPAAERIFGYTSGEILGRGMHEILAAERYRDKAAAGFAHFVKTGTGDVLNKTLELAALRKDGSEFPVELSVAGFQTGGNWHSVAIVRDITEQNRLIAATEYRGTLLHAISITAKELLGSATIEDAIGNALKTVGEMVHADRVLVFENMTPPKGVPAFELRFAWHSANAPVIVDAAFLPPGIHADPGDAQRPN